MFKFCGEIENNEMWGRLFVFHFKLVVDPFGLSGSSPLDVLQFLDFCLDD